MYDNKSKRYPYDYISGASIVMKINVRAQYAVKSVYKQGLKHNMLHTLIKTASNRRPYVIRVFL